MMVSRFAKSLLYTGLSAVLTVLAVVYQGKLHAEAGPEDGYFVVHRVMFLLAVVLMGVGVYSFLSYTRKRKHHRGDSLMLLLTGMGLMAVTLALWIGFGGVQEPFDATGYLAVNIQITVLTALPVPFWIRGLVLACTTHEENGKKRLVAKLCSLATAVLLLVLIATGGLMRMMYFDSQADAESARLESQTVSEMIKGGIANV